VETGLIAVNLINPHKHPPDSFKSISVDTLSTLREWQR